MKKKMDYANKQGIPFVALIGDNEVKERMATVKNMTTGEQQSISFDDIVSYIKTS